MIEWQWLLIQTSHAMVYKVRRTWQKIQNISVFVDKLMDFWCRLSVEEANLTVINVSLCGLKILTLIYWLAFGHLDILKAKMVLFYSSRQEWIQLDPVSVDSLLNTSTPGSEMITESTLFIQSTTSSPSCTFFVFTLSHTVSLKMQPIPAYTICRKAQGHVSDLVVQDAEAQSCLSFLQLDHLSLSLPHGQRRWHRGHATLGDVLRRRTGNDTALVQLGWARRREGTRQRRLIYSSEAYRLHSVAGLSEIS